MVQDPGSEVALYPSGAVVLAVPGYESPHAFGQRHSRSKAADPFQQRGARPGRRHIAGLHRQLAAQRLAAEDLFDDSDEIIEPDRTAAADIDHAIGRAAFRRM